jgi:tetratricopeptide (TPR) repeat protein
LDNADDKDTDYSQYFPSGTRGAILMTSRIPDSRRYCTVGTEQLQSLDSSNCSNLLLRAAEIPYELWNEHEAAAERVISALGSHTLALIQAGAYISQGYCSIKSYPEEYQRQCKKLMEFSPKQAESRYCNVYATFEASAQVLEASNDEASRDALDLLNLLSIFHNEKVPLLLFEDAFLGIQDAQELPDDDSRIEILSTWHVSHLPQFMQVDLEQWDQFRLQRAQTLLRSLALITAGEERSYPTISMHPLTHNWSSTRQERNLTQSLKSIGCLYALLAYGKREIVPYETPLRLHLQKFINQQMHSEYNTSTSMKTSQVLYQCCQLLHYLRLDVLLTETLGILFQRLKLDPREPTERFLQLYKLGANNLYYMGKSKQAVVTWEKIIEIENTTLADDHERRLESEHQLSVAYIYNRQFKDAITLLEHIVKVRETLREDHPNRLSAQHVLALAHVDNGQIKDAINLLEHVVKVQTTIAEDHPDRLASQYVLAKAYLENGQIKGAINLLEHIVKVRETTLAEDHPERLSSQHALGTAYLDNGRIKDGIRLLEQVVKVETILAEGDPDRLLSQHTLARAYLDN